MEAKTICSICDNWVEYEIEDDQEVIAIECFAGIVHAVYKEKKE